MQNSFTWPQVIIPLKLDGLETARCYVWIATWILDNENHRNNKVTIFCINTPFEPFCLESITTSTMLCWHSAHDSTFSWSLTSLFSTNMAISEKEGQGWKAITTQWRKASDILTLTMAAFLLSIDPKRERDRDAHLNYCTSAYNRGRKLSQRKLVGV